MENRDQLIRVRVTQEELDRIREKMKESGILNMSAYARKMMLDGICVQLDLTDVKEMVTQLRRCDNNLNQYAKKANETGSIYAADIEGLRKRLDEIWEQTRKMLVSLSKIT